MWDRFFRQRAYIGITRSCMRWYVRKNYLTRVKQWKSRSGVREYQYCLAIQGQTQTPPLLPVKQILIYRHTNRL